MSPRQIAILHSIKCESDNIGWQYCKSSRVLYLASQSLCILDEDSERRLFSQVENNSPIIEELYAELINLVKDGIFIEGQGNFGSEDCGPADPIFNECCLTQQGKALVA